MYTFFAIAAYEVDGSAAGPWERPHSMLIEQK
jgi:hypothetical protein